MNKIFSSLWLYNELILKKGGNEVERLSLTLLNSKIKLTPHQISSALFAFNSPISKGVILADEVGLGKTIEAGIIIAQYWFEKKAKILIITPASLMKQWKIELNEKFNLPTEIFDRKVFNYYECRGIKNPFLNSNIINICSYQFASNCSEQILLANYDLIIIDEAHNLRNVYTNKGVISSNIKYASSKSKTILLTATPIQNSLMDLYGLSLFIDENIFGNIDIFKYLYIKNYEDNVDDLKARTNKFLNRNLRENVKPYIKFTKRNTFTYKYKHSLEEKMIYDKLRNIINNSEEYPYIIPKNQRHLLLLILCKLMGSSLSALSGTLDTIKRRLMDLKFGICSVGTSFEYDDNHELLEDDFNTRLDGESDIDYEELDKEIEMLEQFILTINNNSVDTKYETLKKAIDSAFNKLEKNGYDKKIIIFTESRKTQKFLYDNLTKEGFEDIIMFNGQNSDDKSNKIYKAWLFKHDNLSKKINSKNINMRTAILDFFKNKGKILICTEAGSEGLNLQFCSTIINYDLPWNPQKVEQRIGRCHRFGQTNDVSVINFINEDNVVEERVYELLKYKFKLFDEVFGASDEILGKYENIENIEEFIKNVYINCRTPEEINKSFELLQKKFNKEIDKSVAISKKILIDNFEEDIQNYFEDTMKNAELELTKYENYFWKLSKIILDKKAIFNDQNYSFEVSKFPEYNGKYQMFSRNQDNEFSDFSLNTDLGKYVLKVAKNSDISTGKILFDITNYKYNLNQIKKIKNKKGFISLNKISVNSFENEEMLFFVGVFDDGKLIEQELIEKLFRLDTYEYAGTINENDILNENVKIAIDKFTKFMSERNDDYLYQEIKKIEKWAEDNIISIELEVEKLREQRKTTRLKLDQSNDFKEKIFLEDEITKITKIISKKWLELSEREENVECQRNNLIQNLKKDHMKNVNVKNIFTIEFEVI